MKLAKMKVVEMRKELDSRGLDSSGTRPTLMKRLREALNREEEEERAREQHSEEVLEPDQPPTTDDLQSPPRAPNAEPQKGQVDSADQMDRSQERQPPTPPKEQASSAIQIVPSTQAIKSIASGSIDHSSALSMDERMRKRLERFGAVSSAPDTTDDAIQRRRKRFGTSKSDSGEKPSKRRRSSNELDEQALKEHEEAKKRRAIKFGISVNAGKKQSEQTSVSADEVEKRLRRQRRFQHVGS